MAKINEKHEQISAWLVRPVLVGRGELNQQRDKIRHLPCAHLLPEPVVKHPADRQTAAFPEDRRVSLYQVLDDLVEADRTLLETGHAEDAGQRGAKHGGVVGLPARQLAASRQTGLDQLQQLATVDLSSAHSYSWKTITTLNGLRFISFFSMVLKELWLLSFKSDG